MRILLTSVAILLLLASCGGPGATGRLSEDLDSISMTIDMTGPAMVEGVPSDDTDLDDLIRLSPAHGVTEIHIQCSASDSARLQEVADSSSATVRLETVTSEQGTRVLSAIRGLEWEPRYEWSFTGNDCLFQGMVVLFNSTGQTWLPRQVDVLDQESRLAATTNGVVTIPEGPTVVRWWQSNGTALDPHLIYGWPRPARWNLVTPCLLQSPGPVVYSPEDHATLGWPVRTGDTLWVDVEADLLSIQEELEQLEAGLAGVVLVENHTNAARRIRIRYPGLLPRGAVFIPEEEIPEALILDPFETRALHYTVSYDLSDRRLVAEVDREGGQP
jgi:hypothetical protein